MKSLKEISMVLLLAAFFVAGWGENSRAADAPDKGAAAAEEDGVVSAPAQGEKKVSLASTAVENPTLPLLDKIMRDLNDKLQQKIEAEFARQLEEKLSKNTP